jgi:MFS family permease
MSRYNATDVTPQDGRGVVRHAALQTNLIAVSAAIFLMSLGENLWRKFVPKYLEALGAPVTTIGFFGTAEDFLDGVYQYPGGWLGDRLGRRTALIVFVGLATIGYAVYWFAPSWPWIFVGLVFVSAWASMASPTLFAVVGDSVPSERRAVGFTIQAVLRRVPILIAPTIGGLAIAAYGITGGVRATLVVTILLAAVTIVVIAACISIPRIPDPDRTRIAGVWRLIPPPLRRLLLSDVFIRTCEGMVDVFLVLYATNIVGIRAPQFGILIAIQTMTSMIAYAPAARFADRFGRKPFVIATFAFFALFPVAVVLSRGFPSLCAAFVVGGLRELGEPARKAMIVDMVQPVVRARSIGLYYLMRSVAISPSAFVGGLLWKIAPAFPFAVAGAIGLVGTIVFAMTVEERYAS